MTKRSTLATSFRLTPECRQLLSAVATRLGVSQRDIVEMGIRHIAKREKVRPERSQQAPQRE